jgi:hypothetical protein
VPGCGHAAEPGILAGLGDAVDAGVGAEPGVPCREVLAETSIRGIAQGWYFVIRIIDLTDIKLETRDTRPPG